jgi:hypothetical protein
MSRRRLALAAAVVAFASAAAAALAPELDKALRDSEYVYIQSERKTGEFGKPAEIWFMYDDGKVYVGTRPTSWRVKRIKAGRPKAKIAVGKPDGPSFAARGELVQDRALEKRLMETYAKKYPEGWKKHEEDFRKGFETGERLLVRYTPAP